MHVSCNDGCELACMDKKFISILCLDAAITIAYNLSDEYLEPYQPWISILLIFVLLSIPICLYRKEISAVLGTRELSKNLFFSGAGAILVTLVAIAIISVNTFNFRPNTISKTPVALTDLKYNQNQLIQKGLANFLMYFLVMK